METKKIETTKQAINAAFLSNGIKPIEEAILVGELLKESFTRANKVIEAYVNELVELLPSLFTSPIKCEVRFDEDNFHVITVAGIPTMDELQIEIEPFKLDEIISFSGNTNFFPRFLYTDSRTTQEIAMKIENELTSNGYKVTIGDLDSDPIECSIIDTTEILKLLVPIFEDEQWLEREFEEE